MKNIEEMTIDEIQQQIIALENRLLDLKDKTFKTGILKHDVYDVPTRVFYPNKYGVVSPQEKAKAVKNYESAFKLIATKGTKFYCNLCSGQESWSGKNGEFLLGDKEWAENNLENIQDVQ